MKLLVLSVFVAVASATYSFTPCNFAGPIQLNNIQMSPDPIPNGGRYHLSYNIDVLSDLDANQLVLKSSVKRNFYGTYLPFPLCTDDFGSCTINACQRPGFPAINPFFFLCSDNGVLTKGHYESDEFVFFPGLDGFENIIVNGDYQATITASNSTTNAELGCYQISYSVAGSSK